jgi:hypothetical protein
MPPNELRAERLIHLTKNADFSTLNHELFHAKLKSLDEAGRKEWADAIGLTDNSEAGWNKKIFDSRDGKEKINAHEYLAELWEDYLADKNNPEIPPKLKTLFDRIAEAMGRVYKMLERAVRDVPPEIKTLMDRLVMEGESGKQAADAMRTRCGRDACGVRGGDRG